MSESNRVPISADNDILRLIAVDGGYRWRDEYDQDYGPLMRDLSDVERAAKLAQLGELVLEILREQRLTADGITRAARATNARAADAGWLALDAARSLGLLGDSREAPAGGEASKAGLLGLPSGQAPSASPAVPPAPLGLEEQLRAIWAEEYDRSVSPTAVPRDEHWRMAALRRAAAETPLARLGADFLEDMKAGRIDLYRSMRVARDLNLLPEPDKDTK